MVRLAAKLCPYKTELQVVVQPLLPRPWVPGDIRKISIEVQSNLPGGTNTEAAISTFTTPSTYQLTQSVTVDTFGFIIYDASVTSIVVLISICPALQGFGWQGW